MKLTIADSVWWPVVIEVPADGGKIQRLEVEGKFRLYTDHEYADWLKRPAADLLDAALLDWRVIEDEDGKPLPFSADALADLKRIRWGVQGFVRGFMNAHNGAGAKN